MKMLFSTKTSEDIQLKTATDGLQQFYTLDVSMTWYQLNEVRTFKPSKLFNHTYKVTRNSRVITNVLVIFFNHLVTP